MLNPIFENLLIPVVERKNIRFSLLLNFSASSDVIIRSQPGRHDGWVTIRVCRKLQEKVSSAVPIFPFVSNTIPKKKKFGIYVSADDRYTSGYLRLRGPSRISAPAEFKLAHPEAEGSGQSDVQRRPVSRGAQTL